MKKDWMKAILFLIYPYLLLSSQIVLNRLEEDFNWQYVQYHDWGKYAIYFLVAIAFGILIQLMKIIDSKRKLIIEGINLLFLILCGIRVLASLDIFSSLLGALSPFTTYLTYSFSSVIGIIYIGIILVDFIIEVLKQNKNK